MAPRERCAKHLRGNSGRWLLASIGLVVSSSVGANQGDAAPPAYVSQTLFAQALAYEHGEGVPKDQLKAVALYCKAARDGDVEAAFNLGWMYANGRGVARDDAIAAALFARAAREGHVHAQRMQAYVGEDRDQIPDCLRPPDPPLIEEDDPDPFSDLPPRKKQLAELATKVALRYAVEPRLVLAVIAAESNFQPDAHSIKNALGLMQLIPETAARFNVKNRRDVQDNVRGGVAYLRWLLAYYEGQVELAVAAYNAGEAAVDKYKGIPPYAETRNYVRRVLSLFRNSRHPYDPRIADPSPMLTRAGSLAK